MRLKDAIIFCRRSPFEAAFIAALVGAMVAYGGSKPVITEEKIKVTESRVDGKALTLKWKCDDKRVVPGKTLYIIYARERPIKLGRTTVFKPTNTDWYEIGRTTDSEIAAPGVWTDKTREIKIITLIEDGQE